MENEYFSNRRSCRFYKPNSITFDEIEKIIKEAQKAPTCGNMQLYSVVVTMDEERLSKISSFHYNQPAASTAPAILTICADFKRFTRWCELRNADAGFNNFHSFITAMTDAVIFAQQIVTVAEMSGFGSCYLGTVNYNAEEISRFLELPELVVPVASVSLGIPSREGEETPRLETQAILHKEKYHLESEAEILNYYKAQEEDENNKLFIEENGKDNLAQVFSEIRYPRSTNEKISHTFQSLLKIKGFIG